MASNIDRQLRFGSTGWLLVLLILVVPAIDSIPGVAEEPLWRALMYLTYILTVTFILVVPWINAGWARRLRRSLSADNPSAVTSIVDLERHGQVCMAVLLADTDSLRFIRKDSTDQILWSDVSDIRVIQEGVLARETIEVTGPEGRLLRFSPQVRSGLVDITPHRRAKLAADLVRIKHRLPSAK